MREGPKREKRGPTLGKKDKRGYGGGQPGPAEWTQSPARYGARLGTVRQRRVTMGRE